MRTLRLVITTILSLSLLFGSVSSAFAGSAAHYTARLNNATIPWNFPLPDGLSSFCPGVPEGVQINPDDLGSDRVKLATQRDMPDGSQQIVVTDLIKGTASDNFGVTYTFVYQNDTTYDYDGSTVYVSMKDTFKLKGSNVDFIIGFNWRWAYPADSLEIVQVIDGNGRTIDLVVDPFYFATADGVTEDPSIIPGSWQQLTTRGDPFNCDPL